MQTEWYRFVTLRQMLAIQSVLTSRASMASMAKGSEDFFGDCFQLKNECFFLQKLGKLVILPASKMSPTIFRIFMAMIHRTVGHISDIYIYIYTHTYTYIYIYIAVLYIYVYVQYVEQTCL